jgi:glycosyltransferase involved in cell wall biosynthesis
MRQNNQPLVTVYITNHNYGKYVEQSIQSVLNQEYKNIELIIIDDGSSDNSLDVINKYKQKNIKIISQKNKGFIVSNNIALRLATGKYIIRLDADDYFDKRAIEIMVNEIEKNKNLAIVFPDYYEVDAQNNILKQIIRHDFEKDVTLFDQPAHGACTLIRKNILTEIGGYDENFSRQDGYDLWLGILGKHDIKNINLPLFFYRRHSSNLTNKESKLLETRSQILAKHSNKVKTSFTILGVIPIRGSKLDSSSQPLKKLGKKRIIDYTIDEAVKSKLITEVVVTSPDEEVLKHVENKYKSKVICNKRDTELASLNKSLFLTINNILNKYKEEKIVFDAILILDVNSPFRSTMYIDKMIHVMKIYNVDSVVGVRLEDDIIFHHNGKGLVAIQPTDKLRLERDFKYKKRGGMTLVSVEFFLKNKIVYGGKVGHVQLDEKAAFLLKTNFDIKIAEYIIKERVE